MLGLEEIQQPQRRRGVSLYLNLRRALPHDVARIEALERKAATRLAQQGLYSEKQIEGVLQLGVFDPSLLREKRYWVAENNGEIVAVGGWDTERRVLSGIPVNVPMKFKQGRMAVIRCAYVRPGYELSRAAREVVLAAEAHAGLCGIERFEFACCVHLTALANSLGYERIKTVEIELPNGQSLPFLWMTRERNQWARQGFANDLPWEKATKAPAVSLND